MEISGRNQIKGKVKAVESDTLMAKVEIEIDPGQTVTAVITQDAVEDLALATGDEVAALIKATSVMVIK